MLKKLLDLQAQKRERAKAIADLVTAEARMATDAEFTELETIVRELNTLETQIATAQSVEAINLRAAAPVTTDTQGAMSANDRKDVSKFSFARAIQNSEKLNGVEAEMHAEGIKELRMAGHNNIKGIAIPDMVTRASGGQSVGVPTDGGNSVYTEYKGFRELFRNALVLEQLGVTVITGLQGNLSYVKEDSQIEALWEGESSTATEGKFEVSNLTSMPKRLAKQLKYTNQLLAQSVLSIESLVQKQIAYALGYALQKAALAGLGTGNIPKGILADSNVLTLSGNSLGTNGGELTYKKIVEMETLIADSDSLLGNLGFVMNAVTRGKLKTTEVTPGSPTGRFLMGGSGNELNGYPVAMTNFMPKNGTKGTGTNLSSMIFGDWSQLEIHRWGAIELIVDRITLSADSQTRVVVNDFANILNVRPTSFVKVTDINTTP